MTTKPVAGAARKSNREPKGNAPATPPEAAVEPLKPRPRLFAVLLVFFLIWVGLLVALYLRTVYPMRYPSTATTRPGASALPSAPR
jgi:hypothetical protein